MIKIYTDGSSRGNPGPGGYGIVLLYKDKRKELSQGYKLTTNNRMELLAVIKALEALKNNSIDIIIYSDSKYVVESVEKGWIWNWEKVDFKKKQNPDLWKKFIPLYKKFKIKFEWVKGHSGNIENERCDELANTAQERKLLIDEGYSK
ncbi:MAG: ribonuclease HI [Cytophagales bacterium]|jgi:ribonuclease HI|nr:MAG: ribonuclease HI [Rhodothermaeota bacterium MED-G19]|tara:strand:+ start:24 stop:467 length:444 start_codon:yes stop_codon:yes gene_type:complete